jgi:hypothetical protein
MNPEALTNVYVLTMNVVTQDDQINKDYILAYIPRDIYIRTIPILTTASKTIAMLWINFYLNKA